MSVPHLSAIESMLARMRAVANAASALPPSATDGATQAGGFAEVLARSLTKVSAMQGSATAQARAFELGAPGVSLNDVMIDMQKAGIAFQATVQIRNRLVAAYQEIASMPV